MHIGVVGGLVRSGPRYARVAERRGHSLEWHSGRTSRPGQDSLRALVERCQLVIVQTDVNSHGAVLQVRRLSRAQRRPLLLVRRLGLAGLERLLDRQGAAAPVDS
jgi:hypothetical protein